MPSKSNPRQQDFTLRFKCDKTTIVLLCNQTHSFSSIKEQLFDAIKSTDLHEIGNHPLPSRPQDIRFGLPIDKNDLTKGWIDLEPTQVEDDDAPLGSSVKGKASSARGATQKSSKLNDNPVNAGLKDGAVLAFKFSEADSTNMMDVNDDWHVIIPSFDDEPVEPAMR